MSVLPTMLQIRKAVNCSGETQKKIASKIGCNEAYMSQFLKHGKRRELLEPVLRRYFERRGISFLGDGKGVVEGIRTIDSEEAIANEQRAYQNRRKTEKSVLLKILSRKMENAG